ncbi:unnamed protein product [Linum tenue]|uniref:Uncharacterized protein n=2 Tax=Linum TaxID=4005 RepID=A0AAV0L3L1_9ROSI|nr:unnamed protein product [Linum tenue]
MSSFVLGFQKSRSAALPVSQPGGGGEQGVLGRTLSNSLSAVRNRAGDAIRSWGEWGGILPKKTAQDLETNYYEEA